MVAKFVEEKRKKREIGPERGQLRQDPQESFWKLPHTPARRSYQNGTWGHVNSSLAVLPIVDRVSRKVLPITNWHVSKVSRISGILQA